MRLCAHCFKYIYVLLIFPCVVVHAASFDCATASKPEEVVICTNRKLGQMDEDIASAYTKLLSAVEEPLRKYVRNDQRNWLKLRTDPKILESVMCARLEGLRDAFLPLNGVMLLRLSGDRTPMYLASMLPGAEIYNQWVAKRSAEVIGQGKEVEGSEEKAAEAAKSWKADENCFADCLVLSTIHYSIDFVSPELISLHESISTYMGGAHPDNQDTHYNWWFSKPGKVTIRDIFTNPRYSKVIIREVAKYFEHISFDRESGYKTALNTKNWAITSRSLHITGQGYDFGTGRGLVEIDIPWNLFKGMVNPRLLAVLAKYPMDLKDSLKPDVPSECKSFAPLE